MNLRVSGCSGPSGAATGWYAATAGMWVFTLVLLFVIMLVVQLVLGLIFAALPNFWRPG